MVVNPNEISSFRRLGKLDPNFKKPRQLLVKFRNMYTVDKIQARASMLKTYEPRYMGVNYAVFISKSLTKDEQEKEQQLLKRRRELLNKGSDPKSIKIQKGVLFLNNRAETKSDWLLKNSGDIEVICYNIRSIFKLDRRKTFSNFILLNNPDIVCLSETWLTTEILETELFLNEYN